jgi:hypothetical protein
MPTDLGRPAEREESLLQAPIVLALDPETVPLIRAGAARAGGDPTFIVAVDPDLRTLLAAVHGVGAEFIVAVCSSVEAAARAVRHVTARRGRALPVLGISDGIVDIDTRTLLRDATLDALNVAVPALAEADRTRLWDSLRAERIEERHHLVEVDGRPALDALDALAAAPPHPDAGLATGLHGVAALAAGAAGVLAGRLVAGGRRWRDAVP